MGRKFSKYHGAGNDFVMIDGRTEPFDATPERVAALCRRRTGIGADGLMILESDPAEEFRMRYFNADGGEATMCGNGGRCIALFAHHLGIGGETKFFDAADGLHTARICRTKGPAGKIELGMTAVREIRTGEGWWFLNTGVPHYVEFVDDLASVDVISRGRIIRRDTARFAQGTNVNFVQITDDGTIRVRTYERGVENETLACGTGATAAAIVTNFVFQPQTAHYAVSVPGGELAVRFSHEQGTQTYTDIRLTGPARRVFGGVFDSENF